jgi:carbon storage regulator CsrA
MLILRRKAGQNIRVEMGEELLNLTLIKIKDGEAFLGFSGPPSINILREEIYLRNEKDKQKTG